MEQQVLTNEQMKELEALGIDTSNASMCWYPDNDPDFPNNPIYMLTCIENIGDGYKGRIPTFTLQDILGMLPMSIKLKDNKYAKLVFDKWGRLEYVLTEYGEVTGALHYVDHTITTLLDSAFEMLKWCKQNEYI